jgi:predicted DNA-binding protein (MmcQ/YjbR family)
MNIEELQSLCKSLPAVTEDVKWGHDLVFSIGGKMFVVVALSGIPTTASFKVSDEEFDEISSREGFMPAPYLARHKWVFINNISKLSNAEWKKYLKQSYELVKEKLPAKTKKQLGI